jgi:hypothetical protein
VLCLVQLTTFTFLALSLDSPNTYPHTPSIFSSAFCKDDNLVSIRVSTSSDTLNIIYQLHLDVFPPSRGSCHFWHSGLPLPSRYQEEAFSLPFPFSDCCKNRIWPKNKFHIRSHPLLGRSPAHVPYRRRVRDGEERSSGYAGCSYRDQPRR